MKKLILSLTALAAITTYSCSKDDSSSSDCCTVTSTVNGTTMTTKYCKKDANTITVTTNGVSTDISGTALGGVSVDAYMTSLKSAGCK